jgi:tetratricopeptide (TPR) repeat protein
MSHAFSIEIDSIRRFYSQSLDDKEALGQVLNALGMATGTLTKPLITQSKHEPKRASEWRINGINLLSQRKYDEAIQAYDKAIELNPEYSDWYHKGIALASQGKHDEAIQAYDKAIELNPKYSDAWINKGNILFCQHKYNETVQALEKGFKLNPLNFLLMSRQTASNYYLARTRRGHS